MRRGDEEFAKAVLSPPAKTTLARAIPFPGVVIILGDRQRGKTGLAMRIMDHFKKKRGIPGCLYFPSDLPRRKRRALPKWVEVVCGDLTAVRKKRVVVVDEASLTAHARRTQSETALLLDNLVAISAQRQQLIIFIAHFSRKLDPNVVTQASVIIWKQPTYAHYLLERDEMQMFTRRAIEVFAGLHTERQRLRTSYVMDFRHLRFATMTNDLPDWWSDELARIFEDIKSNHETERPKRASRRKRKSE